MPRSHPFIAGTAILCVGSLLTGGAPRARSDEAAIVSLASGPKGAEVEISLAAGGGKAFKDCAAEEVCPEMVVVPDSRPGFKIGSPPSEASPAKSETQEAVTVHRFAVGRLEVTVGEYKRCVAAGGCRPPEWLEPGGQHNIETGTSSYYRNLGETVSGDAYPVVGVSWDDAAAYARWLAATTGKPYRLLSEAEWEHAARAGATTRYWWGEEISPGGKVMAACRGCGSEWDAKRLAPAQSFEPNPWGLYNVHGNVWEWVADFYCDSYASGPHDGSARSEDSCAVRDGAGLHVLRGGSSFYGPDFARAATRLRNFTDFRNFSVGFRVARSLP